MNEGYVIHEDYIVAARRVLTQEAADRYIAGDNDATDKAGHDLIAEEASRVAEERIEFGEGWIPEL